MDFEAIWNNHKPFIIRIAAGALIFLCLMGVRSSIAEATDRYAKQNASKQGEIVKTVGELSGAEGLEIGREQALGAKLEPALRKTILWEGEPAFLLPEKERNPSIFYSKALETAKRRIKAHGERWHAKVPQELGVAASADGPLMIEELARLDLLSRVVVKLLDAGIREITAVEAQEVSYFPQKGEKQLLRNLPVRFVFMTTCELLAKALRELAVEGSFLEIVHCRLSRGDKDGVIEVELTLQALSLVDSAPEGSIKRGGGTSRAGDRRGGTTRRHFGRER